MAGRPAISPVTHRQKQSPHHFCKGIIGKYHISAQLMYVFAFSALDDRNNRQLFKLKKLAKSLPKLKTLSSVMSTILLSLYFFSEPRYLIRPELNYNHRFSPYLCYFHGSNAISFLNICQLISLELFQNTTGVIDCSPS